MRIKIEPHRDYQCLKPDEATALYDTAKRLLRVGFEIEFNATDDFDDDPDENRMSTSMVNELLATIQGKFETEYGFTMAIGKDGMNKKKLKRVFSDGTTRIEVPLEIDIDGYLEHLPVPYGYYDGSTPVELVTSPVEPSIEAVREIFSKVYDVVESIDHVPLMPNCHRDCGLHQTVVFEHLKPKFPEIVVANTIQITRAYMPGLYYLLSSGNLETPSRSLRFRNHNPSIWKRHVSVVPKYSAVYPRTKTTDSGGTEYWGIEFRYPDGTRSMALAAAMAIVNTAIVLKAIKLSRYGVVKISDEYYQNVKSEITRLIGYKTITVDEIRSPDFFPKTCAEGLVQFLSEEILDTDRSAFPLIRELLKQPVWIRMDSYSDMVLQKYRDIDAQLFASTVEGTPADTGKGTIQMAVEMDYSTAKDRRNAVRRIATRIQKTYADTNRLLQQHGYIWSDKLTKFVPMKG